MNEELEYALSKQHHFMHQGRMYHESSVLCRSCDTPYLFGLAKSYQERSDTCYSAARDILMQILTPQMELTLDEKGLPVWHTTNT